MTISENQHDFIASHFTSSVLDDFFFVHMKFNKMVMGYEGALCFVLWISILSTGGK